jgi:hypothetical protein
MATTFTPSAGNIMRPWGKCEVRHYPEDASQTFKAGYPVILGGAGLENKVKVAADNPTAAIVGVAAGDASGTTGALVPVYLAKPEFKFIVTTVAGDPVDFTDIGSCRALQAHASLTIWVVDTTDAGNDSVVVEGYLNPTTMIRQTVEGDSEVYAIVHFDPKATIFGAGT